MGRETTTTETVKIFQVKDWDRHFEGAKSKTYNNKTTCMMPTKHSLGYRRMVRAKDGVAMFGAWCALIQVLSRHNKKRNGYCTDNGGVHGSPYSAFDLEMLTDIPEAIFVSLFSFAQTIDWLAVTTVKDTTVSPQLLDKDTTGIPRYPSHLDLDLDSDLDMSGAASDSKPSPVILTFPCTGKPKKWDLTQIKIDEWSNTYETAAVPAICKEALQWILDNPTRKKTARGMTKFLGGWISREINGGRRHRHPIDDDIGDDNWSAVIKMHFGVKLSPAEVNMWEREIRASFKGWEKIPTEKVNTRLCTILRFIKGLDMIPRSDPKRAMAQYTAADVVIWIGMYQKNMGVK